MKLLQTIGLSFLGVCFLIMVIVLFRNLNTGRDDARNIHINRIAGVIESYKYLGRTLYDLKIKEDNKIRVVTCFGSVTDNNVFKQEDSIFKYENSHSALIFRKNNIGRYFYQGFIVTWR